MAAIPAIRADGVEIISEIIDEKDNVVKHTLTFNIGQFTSCLNKNANRIGLAKFEIVKRREPSYKGHTHWLRLSYKATHTEYSEYFNDIAKRLASLGYDENMIGYVLSVSDIMIEFWKTKYPAFGEALRQGRKNYMEQVEMTLKEG
jgi:hypothetical protein